jgi:phosphoribosylformylglycinamidine synthase
MRRKVRCVIIAGYGTNCEVEMAYASKLAGAEAEIVHISELLYGEKCLDNYHFLNFPGGFLDGDDLGAAKAAANRWRFAKIKTTGEYLFEQLIRFVKEGKLILGVCNGFQLMVKLGLLPGLNEDYDLPLATLTYNDSGRFEDRWVYMQVDQDSPCIFTRGLDNLYLPVRHAEGKFIARDKEVLSAIRSKHLVVLRYIHPQTKRPTMEYPFNPNGSINAIAAICNSTGRVFGLMPHPEAYLNLTNHPHWTRKNLSQKAMGLTLFINAVEYIKKSIL